MAEKWYHIPTEDIAEKLSTDLSSGLDKKSVKARRAKYGRNNVFLDPGNIVSACLKAVGADYSFYLLLALVVLAKIFNENVSAAIIITLMVINLVLTLAVYIKSQRILHSMAIYASPTSRVVRGGRIKVVRQSEIVIGDIIILEKGDVVPADARIVYSQGLTVSDQAVTGSDKAIGKSAAPVYGANVPPSEQHNMVFALSTVLSGSARAVVCACGNNTFAAASGKRQEIVPHSDLRVLGRLKKLCSAWSLVMLTFIFFITVADIVFGAESRGLFNIFITAVSLTCAAMAEFYVIFAYFIISSGLFGTLKKNGATNSGAIIKNISSLEEIKEIDAFIVPKMGGFYTDRAALETVFVNETLHRVTEKNLYNYCGRTLKYALLASGYAADPSVLDDPAGEPGAIVIAAEAQGIDRMVLKADYPLVSHAASFAGIDADCSVVAEEGGFLAVARGEAAPLLERCSFYMEDDSLAEIDEHERKYINDALRTIDEDGCRAIAVIFRDTENTDISEVEADGWILAGIIGLREPTLASAEDNIRACLDAGVAVIVLAPVERDPSRVYFKRLGLVENDGQIATGSEMSELSDDEWQSRLGEYRMYEGLSAEQKHTLIRLLHGEGKVVGVLGRTLDDIALFADADVGFASGVTLSERAKSLDVAERPDHLFADSEALKNACDVLVSTPKSPRGGFNAMVKALCTAKTIYQNLMRMVKYLFTAQIARLTVVLYSVIVHNVWSAFSGREFLLPVQILFLGLIVDFGVVVAIAMQRSPSDLYIERENTEERLSRPFIYNFFKPFIFGLFWGVASITAPLILSLTGVEMAGEPLTSLIFISFIITELIVAGEVMYEKSFFAPRKRFNRLLLIMAIGAAVFIALGVLIPGFGARFGICPLKPVEALCAFIVPLLMLGVYEIYKLIKK